MGSYNPEAPPQSVDPELQEYLMRELARVGDALIRAESIVLGPTNVIPDKPEEGTIVYADGTNFNPTGQGEGVYAYVNGAWVKLSSSAADLLVQFIGCIQDFGGVEANVPAFWLPCFGQSLLRAGQYATLFNKIGTTHGAVDGTHFNVPDYRGRVSAGQDDMGGTSANRLTSPLDGDVLGNTGGAENVTLAIANLPAHDHGGVTGAEAVHIHQIATALATGGAVNAVTRTGGTGSSPANIATAAGNSHTHTISSQGSGTPVTTIQPTIIVNKIIYAGA